MKKPKPSATPTTAVKVSPKEADAPFWSDWAAPEWTAAGLAALVAIALMGRLTRRRTVQSARTPAPLPADHRVGPYHIESLIANGGTATVYLGTLVSGASLPSGNLATSSGAISNTVAIKIPHTEQLRDRKFVATFLREAQIGLELRHPSIVRVLHVGSYRPWGFAQVPYFVMEHLEGQELDHLIHNGETHDPQFATMVARSVADALQWAHSRGVVHRDISPANIFITSKRLVKVMDFGISSVSAKFTGKRSSKALSFGTPAYLAPERIADSRSNDPRSDIYSLGCVMYEMVVGTPPYSHEKPEEVIKMHSRSPIPSLREQARVPVSVEFEALVRKMLAKDPKDRYQSAGEVISALSEFIPSE